MKFLSIKEATQNYKVSRATVSRFAKKHLETKNVKKENGKYLILETFLDSHFLKLSSKGSQILKTDTSKISQKPSSKKENNKDVDLVAILREQLSTKDVQIDKMDKQLSEKDNQINKLLQRQSEQNIIIQTMQNRFEALQNGIDNGVKMLSEKTKDNNHSHKSTDNGFTMAASIMIILLVVMIVVYLTVK